MMKIGPYLYFSAAAVLLISLGTDRCGAAPPVKSSYLIVSPECNATMAKCTASAEEEELLMESEVSRRILAGDPPLSYDALQKPPVCNAKIYGNCIKPVNGVPGRCTYYNRCKRSPR